MTIDLVESIADSDAEDLAARPRVDPRTIPTRYSLLKQMQLSPAHYEHACQQPQDDSMSTRLGAFASDRKESYRVGGAIHAMLVGGKVLVYPARRDPRVKAWQEFQAEAAAKGVTEIVSPAENAIVTGVVSALRARPDAMRLLFDGTIIEQRIDWTWMGKAVRSTPDARVPSSATVDLKSAVTADPAQFGRHNRRLWYHAQAALYGQAMEAIGEGRPDSAYLVVVEKSPPHPVTIFRFTAELLELGAKMNRLWMERLAICEATNHWPVYAPEGTVIDLDVEPEFGSWAGAIEADGKLIEVSP